MGKDNDEVRELKALNEKIEDLGELIEKLYGEVKDIRRLLQAQHDREIDKQPRKKRWGIF